METPEHRKWMDKRVGHDKRVVTDEFMIGVEQFLEFACAQDHFKSEGVLRCPCKKCKCRAYHSVENVKGHLCMKGFMSNYYYWTSHGEQGPPIPPVIIENSYYGSSGVREDFNNYEQMVMDAAGPSIGNYIEQQGFGYGEQMTEDPNPIANFFFICYQLCRLPCIVVVKITLNCQLQ